jgi:hypothetical protein
MMAQGLKLRGVQQNNLYKNFIKFHNAKIHLLLR